jgi:hypothetical protein
MQRSAGDTRDVVMDGDVRVVRDRDRDRRVARASTAAPAILIGSVVLIVAAFLDWVGGRDSASDANGFQIPDGRVVLGIGAALLVVGILMAKNRRVGSWFDADLLATALSTIGLVTVGAFWAYLGSDERSPDVGLYVAAAGAAIAMVGSLSALLRSGSDRLTADDEGRGDVGRGDRR